MAPYGKAKSSVKSSRAEPYGKGKGGKGATAVPRGQAPAKGFNVFIGNLAYETTWQELKDVCRSCGDVERVEVMTEGGEKGGRSRGCAIVEFRTKESAKRAVKELHDEDLNGRAMLVREDRGGNQQGDIIPRGSGKGGGNPGRLFVGNLAWTVTWQELKDVFRTVGDVTHVELMTEGHNPGGRSKGCALVEFRDRRDAKRAIAELHDEELGGRPMLVREDEAGPIGPMQSMKGGKGKGGDLVEAGCRVFVASLDFSVTWQDLKDHMREVGEVVHVEIMTQGGVKGGRSKGFGLVQFETLGAAQRAVNRLHDSILNGRPILVRPSLD